MRDKKVRKSTIKLKINMRQKEPGSVPLARSSKRLVSDVAPGDSSTASPLAHMAAGDVVVVVRRSEENVSAPSLAQEGCR